MVNKVRRTFVGSQSLCRAWDGPEGAVCVILLHNFLVAKESATDNKRTTTKFAKSVFDKSAKMTTKQ